LAGSSQNLSLLLADTRNSFAFYLINQKHNAAAAADRDNSVHTRSETPQGDDVATPRDPEEKKEKDGRDSEGMFELDS
jgi:hypothetical protein